MCSVDNIKLFDLIIGPLKVLIAIYLVYAGSYICATEALHRAYGYYFIEVGAGLIMLGLLSGGLVVPAFAFGLRRHNRFIIISCFVLDTIIMSCLLHLGSTMFTYLTPEFDKDLQSICVTKFGSTYSKCTEFLESDRTAGLRLVWSGLFTERDDAKQYAILKTVQNSVGCCGFFPPLNCMTNKAGFPEDRPLDGINSEYTEQRLQCGNSYDDARFYKSTAECKHYYDTTQADLTVDGCRFDQAIGRGCLALDPGPNDLGCISALEDYVRGLVESHVIVVFYFCPLFNFLGMIFTCCMYWKRKQDEDVFPDFLAEARFEFNYANVKDQFEVQPQANLLQKKGWKPPRKADAFLGIADDEAKAAAP